MRTFRSSMMLRCSRSACTPPPSTAIAFRSTSDRRILNAAPLQHVLAAFHASWHVFAPSYQSFLWMTVSALHAARQWQTPRDGGKNLGKCNTSHGMAAPETGCSRQPSKLKQ